MASLTVQASVLSHTRVVGPQGRNVRSRAAMRTQRMAVRPAVATAEAEALPEAAAPAAEAPAATEQPQQQRRQQRRGPRTGPGPARTLQLSDLEAGKEYDGVVVSIRDFGAFVNIGCQTDGLLHISQISTEFVKNVGDVVANGQDVRVRVMNVDGERGKFAVTMIPEGAAPPPRGGRRDRDEDFADDGTGERPQLKQQARAQKQQRARPSRSAPPVKPGDAIKGKVVSAAGFGVFVEIAEGFTGLLHESEQRRAEGAADLKEGDEVEVVVVSVRGDKVALSQRSADEINQEREMKAAGISVAADLPAGASGTSLLARKLAAAGFSADKYSSAVGAA